MTYSKFLYIIILSIVPKFEKFSLRFFGLVNRKSRGKIARKTIGIKKKKYERLNSNSNSDEISSRLTGASSAARESRIAVVVLQEEKKKKNKISREESIDTM